MAADGRTAVQIPPDVEQTDSWSYRPEAIRYLYFSHLLFLAIAVLVGAVRQGGIYVTTHTVMIMISLGFLLPIVRGRNQRVVTRSFVALIGALLVVAAANGGLVHLDLFWSAVFPPLALFLLGLRLGILFVAGQLAALLLVYAVLLWGTPTLPLLSARYTPALVFHALALYINIFVLSVIYERARYRNYQSIEAYGRRMSESARHDDLTGLLNREGFRQQIRAIAGPVALIMLDIDHFKQINDSQGHSYGDTVLAGVAEHLRLGLRRSDAIARWGGEEFLIAIEAADLLTVHCVAEQLRIRLADAGPVTSSFGVATVEEAGSLDAALKLADRRLYEAKEAGRNRVAGLDDPTGCLDR